MKLVSAFVLLLALALFPACLFGDNRVSEKQAARYLERNRELAAELPVPPGARLVTERENSDCAGSYERDRACFLHLTHTTAEPLVDVMLFFDDYFTSEGWELGDTDPETTQSYKNSHHFLSLWLRIPLGMCPDAAYDADGNERCREEEIRRNDGKSRTYILVISPR